MPFVGAEEYGFEEIYLIPNRCVASSREECNPSQLFGGRSFKSGVIAANMSSVVNKETCEYLSSKGMFYIMHRFQGTNLSDFIEHMQGLGHIASISVGVNQESKDGLIEAKNRGLVPEYITVDIANVFSVKGDEAILFIKDNFPESFLIAGNCATWSAVQYLTGLGVDCVKVGISNGHVCETYTATGFGRPQFSTVLDCCKEAQVPIISDGSIRNIGDISKAFVAGATMVMAGNLFSGYEQSAGEVIEIDGKRYKQYFGSASYNNTRNKKNIEGKCILVEYKNDMQKLLWDIDDGVRSSISYAGGLDLRAFRCVKWGVRNGGVQR